MATELYNNLANVAYAFIVGGILIVLITVRNNDEGSVVATITGYSAMLCAVLLLMALTMINNTGGTTSGLIYTLAPFLLLLVILGLSIGFMSSYFDRISHGQVTPYYGLFTFLSMLFILIQVYIYYSGSQEAFFKQSGNLSPINIAKLMLVGIINIITILTLGVTLKYYSTDG